MRNQEIFAVVLGCVLVVGGISLAMSSLRLIPIATASALNNRFQIHGRAGVGKREATHAIPE